MKTYSAENGYVFQYFYEGHRPFSTGAGTEFVFSLSHDRKEWHHASVLLSDAALHPWEQQNARALTSTERYAVAKMALFGALDGRPDPRQMREPVRVDPEGAAGIIESLGL